MKIGNRFKEYVLKKYLGKGTHGEVWLAEKDKKQYALKFLKSENFDKTRFDKEVEVLKKVKGHKNILTIQDSFTDQGKYVIVTDYANSGSLEDRKTRINSNEALKIITQVLDGVSWLHEIPINHRDIKPGNILLKNKIPCLADFGLARNLNRTQSTSHIEGTKPYFSPELADAYTKQNPNKKLNYKRTIHDDLWAVATTFYFILIKKFPCGSLAERTVRVPLPKNFPQDLIPFFDTAFQEQQIDRFQSAEAMAESLENIRQERVIEQRTGIIKKELGAEFEKKLEEEKAKHQKEKQTLLKQVEVLESETEKKDVEIKNIEETVEFFEEEVKNLEKEKKTLEAELEKKDVETKKLQKEKKAFESKVEEKDIEIKNLQNETEEKNIRVEGLEETIGELSSQLYEEKEKNKLLEKDHKQLKGTLLEFFSKNQQQEKEIQQLRKLTEAETLSNGKLREEVVRLKNKLTETEKKLKFEIASLENTIVKVVGGAEKAVAQTVSDKYMSCQQLLNDWSEQTEKQYQEINRIIKANDFSENFSNELSQSLKDIDAFVADLKVKSRISNSNKPYTDDFKNNSEEITRKLHIAFGEISKEKSQVSILRSLIRHADEFASRGALFIVKNGHLVGWRTFGENKPKNDDTIREIFFPVSSKTILCDSISNQSINMPGDSGIEDTESYKDSEHYLDKIGYTNPINQVAIPLIVRGRGVAVLYADGATVNVEVLEMLVRITGLTVEMLASSRDSEVKQSLFTAPAEMPEKVEVETTLDSQTEPYGESWTKPRVEFDDYSDFGNYDFDVPVVQTDKTPTKQRLTERKVDLPIDIPEDERRLHNDARRFARLLVSEIKLYNEQKVKEGREINDLYDRLKEEIDNSREMYDKRVLLFVAAKFDYYHYELVNTLAEGDEIKLGHSYPGVKEHLFCKNCKTKLNKREAQKRFCSYCGNTHN
jgi:serine/threonine protein kinase